VVAILLLRSARAPRESLTRTTAVVSLLVRLHSFSVIKVPLVSVLYFFFDALTDYLQLLPASKSSPTVLSLITAVNPSLPVL